MSKHEVIWCVNFPLPPSVNEYLMPVATRGGRPRLVKTPIHREFMDRCHIWKIQNNSAVQTMRDHLREAILKSNQDGLRFALKVDAFFVFHVERLLANDANNRLKPALDGLVEILGIDDKHFYSGLCEKVSTDSKDKECTILRISQMVPRTHKDILELIEHEKRDF